MNNRYLLPASIISVILLYTFAYNPKKSEKYCGSCGLK